MDICPDDYIDFYTFKDRVNSNLHWKRYQLGSLELNLRFVNAYLNDKMEVFKVPCLNIFDIFEKFQQRYSTDLIHLLKVDTEGIDFFIIYSLMSRLIDDDDFHSFPIIIYFEVSIIERNNLNRLIFLLSK